MTIQEMQDKLAGLMGWSYDSAERVWNHSKIPEGVLRILNQYHDRRPCPATLDFIAGALPPGWRWIQIIYNQREWSANAMRTGASDAWERGSDELTARFACVIAAWEHHTRPQHGGAKGGTTNG